ncbi:hypothetical protein ABEB36_004540 [Hypothenemus hampei]|uniref:Hexosyltransferase n=1 Tax=Hypothenemus hampei TaxID=57062 RepID=A0ABD1F3P1_HYPHA
MLKLSKYKKTIITLCSSIVIFIILRHLFELSKPTVETNHYLFSNHHQQLLNITLNYKLNTIELCNTSEALLAIVIVTSYFGNVETRSWIRKVFEKHKILSVKLVFLLGEAPRDKYTTQKVINGESDAFRDIVQGNFTEAYRNLTYKHVMGLKWAGKYCSKAKYVVKMDDDTVINISNLKGMLNSLHAIQNEDFIAGYKLEHMKPIRNSDNKWFVTQEEYSESTYPTFLSGWFYITTTEVARKLAQAANYDKFFWIDDVFVTGILSRRLKLTLYDFSEHFAVNSELLQCCLQDFEKHIQCDASVGPNGGDNKMIYVFNEKFQKCVHSKCSKRLKPLNETCVAIRKVNLGQGGAEIHSVKL